MKRHTDFFKTPFRGFALSDSISRLRTCALKKAAGRCLSLMLAALLLIGVMPFAAAADDNVLKTLTHTEAGAAAINGNDIVFTVKNSFQGSTIDFSSGLSFTYDTNKFKNVVLDLDLSTAEVEIDNADLFAKLTVFYLNKNDSNVDPLQKTYKIFVRRAEYKPPKFNGTVSLFAPVRIPTALSAANLQSFYEQNDGGELTHIALSGYGAESFGSFLYMDQPYEFGTPIDVDTLSEFIITSEARDAISFTVNGYMDGDTSTPVGIVILTINSDYSAPQAKGAISVGVTKERIFTFTLEDFTKQCELHNLDVRSITFTPSKSSSGTWLFAGDVMRTGTAKEIPVSEIHLLEFNATVRGSASFTWRVTTDGGTTTATAGTLTVYPIALVPENYTSPDPLGKGGVHAVSSSHLRYKVSSEDPTVDTEAIRPTYLKIDQIPPTKDGYLYLDEALPKAEDGSYPAIAAETALKNGAIIPFNYVSQLRIASNSTSKSDFISFSWKLTADRVLKNADWSDAALYTAPFSEGQNLIYTTDTGVPITFRVDEFFRSLQAATGTYLSYVTFTLPSKDQGALYHNYNILKKSGTAVSSSTKYYYGRNPSLAQVTFVPAADFYGTCVFTYTAFSEDGVRVSGKITVNVDRNPAGTVVLIADKNAPLDLDAGVFRSAFKTATGKELESIQITSTSTYARLYTGYIGQGQYGSVVTSGTRLYMHSSPLLSRTTFVPNNEFTGSVGYNYYARAESGDGYYGRLVVFVVESEGGNVSYPVNTNGYVRLDASDFAAAFTAATGSLLSSVTFTLPAKTTGTLYESYIPATGKGTAVKAATKYKVSDSPSISDIYFVPAANSSGTFDVTYTAYSNTGASFTGKLKFLVGRGDDFGRSYLRLSAHAQAGAPMAMNPDAFRAAFLRATGQPLAGVRFNLPTEYDGRLCTGYVSPSFPGALVSDTTRYLLSGSPALSSVVFVPAANFGSGTVIISFDAYSGDGTAYAGHLKVYVGSASPFDDIGSFPWAADPIAFLADIGVVLGSGNGKFNPNKPITRADFVLMVARAFELSGGSSGFPDVKPGDYYYAAVVAAKSMRIIEGFDGMFHPNSALSRQDAMVILKKTADAMSITLPKGKGSIAQFADADKIADYALEAAQALVAAGVINGSNGKINPRSSISRAEMAAVLYRVLLLKSK